MSARRQGSYYVQVAVGRAVRVHLHKHGEGVEDHEAALHPWPVPVCDEQGQRRTARGDIKLKRTDELSMLQTQRGRWFAEYAEGWLPSANTEPSLG